MHPYFQKRKADALLGRVDPNADIVGNGEVVQRFWDGFQWIVRTNEQRDAAHQNVTDINENAVAEATKNVTGEDAAQK